MPKFRPHKFVIEATVLDEYDAAHVLNLVEIQGSAGGGALKALRKFSSTFPARLEQLAASVEEQAKEAGKQNRAQRRAAQRKKKPASQRKTNS